MSETQSYAWVPSLVVYVFAAGPIMFPMGAVALGSICWPEVVLWNWFQIPVVVNLFQNECSSLRAREKMISWRFVFNNVCWLPVTVAAL